MSGIEFDAGRVLKKLDPIAFNCGMSDHDTEKWRCLTCDTEHSSEADAEECHSKYSCGECGKEFDTEDEAEECCQPQE